MLELYNKKVGLNAKNNVAMVAIFSSNTSFVMVYVRIIQPKLNNNSASLVNMIMFSPVLLIKPSNNGQIMGLAGSHKPIFPKEKMYLPIAIYTAPSHVIPF